MDPSTTAPDAPQPLPPRQWVAILIMADGSCRTSVPLPEYEVAEQVGRFSLLDSDVSSYEVAPLHRGTRRVAAPHRR